MTTILIVEDKAPIAEDIQSTLVRFGYDVPTPVATAAEAIEAAEKLRPALVPTTNSERVFAALEAFGAPLSAHAVAPWTRISWICGAEPSRVT